MKTKLTQEDIQNIVTLINGVTIKVEFAEVVVLLKQKLMQMVAELNTDPELKEVKNGTDGSGTS
jgi:hypothetical protein